MSHVGSALPENATQFGLAVSFFGRWFVGELSGRFCLITQENDVEQRARNEVCPCCYCTIETIPPKEQWKNDNGKFQIDRRAAPDVIAFPT